MGAFLASLKICMPEVEGRCILCMTGKTAEKAMFASVIAALLFIAGLVLTLSAVKGISGAADVLRYGEIATGTVTGIASERRSNPFNFSGPASFRRNITLYRIICGFTTATGRKMKCGFFATREGVIKKDEVLTVIYDPDIEENVLVIEALPQSVDTMPGLAAL